MTLTFTIPKALWLQSNRHHANRAYLQRIRNDLHVIAHAAAQRTGLNPISSPVRCLWTVHYPKGVGWEHGDASNAQPTTKALLDGLVPRWLQGDGPRWVTHEMFTRGPNLDRPSDHVIELTLITEGEQS